MGTPERGVILMNTGSPDSPEPPDVRRYLAEFLMDPYVIDIPWLFRALLVHGIILRTRPKNSSHAYKQVWQPDGSPLITISEKQAQLLEARLNAPVISAMRYGNPGYKAAVDTLVSKGVSEILLIPLFPQFAGATFQSCVEAVKTYVDSQKSSVTFNVADPFYSQPEYISALCESLKSFVGTGKHILFSFHGLPERQLQKTDPTGHHCLATPDCCQTESPAHATCYRFQCLKTVEIVTDALGISEDDHSIAFQSRLGRAEWMKPYTTDVLDGLPKKGVKDLAVICPAFVTDCLETLEEIGIRAKEDFIAAGGETLELVPCLNASSSWINALEAIVTEG